MNLVFVGEKKYMRKNNYQVEIWNELVIPATSFKSIIGKYCYIYCQVKGENDINISCLLDFTSKRVPHSNYENDLLQIPVTPNFKKHNMHNTSPK